MKKLLKKIVVGLLDALARATLKKFKPVLIAVTGSAGKTSTKEAIFAVISTRKRARCSQGNFNSEYALPLTILADLSLDELAPISRKAGEAKGSKAGLFFKVIGGSLLKLMFIPRSSYPEVLVLEYGADKPGDINYLKSIAQPQIAVVTAVGDIPVHVQFYDSPEAVTREKGALIDGLSASSLAILNRDEERVYQMRDKTRATSLTFGFGEEADLQIIDFENKIDSQDGVLKPMGIIFKLGYDGAFVPVRINGTLGKAQAYAGAAAACVGLAFSMNLVDIAEALRAYKPPAGRLQFLRGIHDSIILDDAYNASPLSLAMAIETAKSIKAKRKVAIIGDMLELGSFAKEAHTKVGALAVQVFSVIVAVGPESKAYADAAQKNPKIAKKNILYFENIDQAVSQLPGLIKSGDLVLIKASYSMHLDKAVSALKKQERTII